MTAWTNGELHQIGTAEELETASLQSDGALRNPATIWVVPPAATSTSGPATGAPPPGSAAQVGHEGRIQAGGVEKDVIFVEEAGPGLTGLLDAAYRTRYRRCAASAIHRQYCEPRGALRNNPMGAAAHLN